MTQFFDAVKVFEDDLKAKAQIMLNRRDNRSILRDIKSEIYPNSLGYISIWLILDQVRALLA